MQFIVGVNLAFKVTKKIDTSRLKGAHNAVISMLKFFGHGTVKVTLKDERICPHENISLIVDPTWQMWL